MDYKINFWKEREVELAETREEGEATGEPSTPRLKVQKILNLFRLKSCMRWLPRVRARLKTLVSMRGLHKSRLLHFFFVDVIELFCLHLF